MAARGRKRKFVAASVTQQEAADFSTLRPVVAEIFKTSHLFRKVTPAAPGSGVVGGRAEGAGNSGKLIGYERTCCLIPCPATLTPDHWVSNLADRLL